MNWKDYLMLWQWRFTQFQGVLAPFFYISSLTLLLYPYFLLRFPEWSGEGAHYRGVTAFFGIYLALTLFIMFCAWSWDYMKMWKATQRTVVRRNQFAQNRLTPVTRRIFLLRDIPLMKALDIDTKELEEWIEEAFQAELEEGK